MLLGGVNDDSVETWRDEEEGLAVAAPVAVMKDVVVVGIAVVTARNSEKEIFMFDLIFDIVLSVLCFVESLSIVTMILVIQIKIVKEV